MALCRDSNPRGYCAALFVGVQYCFHLHYVSTVIKLAESSLRTFGGEIPAAIARQALSLIVRLLPAKPLRISQGGTEEGEIRNEAQEKGPASSDDDDS